MKKILSYVVATFIILFGLSSQVFAQTDHKAILLLSTDKPQAVVNVTTSYDLVLNTYSNEIDEIDVQFIIRGPFDKNSMTFKLHPMHTKSRLHQSSPLKVVRYQKILEGDDGVRVHVILKSSDGTPLNEGSSALPIYRVSFRTTETGTIKGYIDSRHSYVKYSDVSKIDYDNYTPESKAKLLSVVNSDQIFLVPISTPTPYPTSNPTTSPTTNPTIYPTSMPESSPITGYEEEVEQVTKEIEELKKKVEKQEERLSLLERVVQSIKNFFGNIFN